MISEMHTSLTRGVALVIYGIGVSTHHQHLLHSLHVTEVGGQAQWRVTCIRPDLERCLVHGGRRMENGHEWRAFVTDARSSSSQVVVRYGQADLETPR